MTLNDGNIKVDVKQLVTDKIIKILENDPSLWQKTWQKIGNPSFKPYNPVTGTQYKGINLCLLSLTQIGNQLEDNRWCTYHQAKFAGHPVMKGETSMAQAIYYVNKNTLTINKQTFTLSEKSDKESCKSIINIFKKYYHKTLKITNIELNNVVELIKEYKKNSDLEISYKTSPVLKYSPLFNVSQLEYPPKLFTGNNNSEQLGCNSRAESILKNSGVRIFHDQFDQNYYNETLNTIHLTRRDSFNSLEGYYSTALHELSHAKMRDGSMNTSFNLDDYHKDIKIRAQEELRAELSSVFICAEIGMSYDLQNHSSYINSWIKAFQQDKNEFFSAVMEATKLSNACLEKELNFINEVTPVDLDEDNKIIVPNGLQKVTIHTEIPPLTIGIQNDKFKDLKISFMNLVNDPILYSAENNSLLCNQIDNNTFISNVLELKNNGLKDFFEITLLTPLRDEDNFRVEFLNKLLLSACESVLNNNLNNGAKVEAKNNFNSMQPVTNTSMQKESQINR
ncbi:MAG: ssDNA-binding domain-containing protein [Burkholderiales bacterium]|nr:ssDNA-binding domain-containing protein [Burkholderiales bacterium]